MSKMKEPPMGSVILDSHGSAWQRHPVGWCIAGGDGSWSYTWAQLSKELYTIDKDFVPTQTWAPVVHQLGKVPRILFVPGEELINGEEK